MRRNRLENGRFHNLQLVATELRETFDINILEGFDLIEIEFAKLMFHRRHVYEHGGGEADEKYEAQFPAVCKETLADLGNRSPPLLD